MHVNNILKQALAHADDTSATVSSITAAAVSDKMSRVLPQAGRTTRKAEGTPSGDLGAPPRTWQVRT
jgi:hypothetical protein